MEPINYTRHFTVWSTSVTNHCALLHTFKSLCMVSFKKINYLAIPLWCEHSPWLKVHCLVSPGFVFQPHITGCTWRGLHSCQDKGNSNETEDLLFDQALWESLSWSVFVDRNDLVKERPTDLPNLVLSYCIWEDNSRGREIEISLWQKQTFLHYLLSLCISIQMSN